MNCSTLLSMTSREALTPGPQSKLHDPHLATYGMLKLGQTVFTTQHSLHYPGRFFFF